MSTTIKGYKVTNADGTCRGMQYEIGKTYKHKGPVGLCEAGFHFCLKAADCFNYYNFNSENRVFEVEAGGEVIHGDDKSVCAEITFTRELTWQETLAVCNEGKDNTGRYNTGYRNTGDRNTGYSNTGYRNTGDSNTGDSNTGDRNTGDSNTGDRNTGDRNTGNWNTGYRNTGYSNTGNRNTGAFCTVDAPFPLFNKPSDWTEQDFLNSRAYQLMSGYVDTKLWVSESVMTEEEKKAYPAYKTAGGYVKDIPFKEAFKNAWHNFDERSREAFTSLPNFDPAVFQEITGVDPIAQSA